LGHKDISEHTAQQVDKEVRRIIQECHAEATRLLKAHRSQLDALAKALLERETLDEVAIQEVTGLKPSAVPGPEKHS
jgi:cell division protease FtsH